jgi:putative PEP-CTERM system TPR-repeat lipoprotein
MNNKLKLIIPVLITTLLTNACSENKTTEEYVNSAIVAMEEGDEKTAAINLKNVLRRDGNNDNARLLLGKVYLQLGSGVNAEKELQKAYELGNTDAAVFLLRAYKIQNKYAEIIKLSSELSLNESEDWALVEVYKALALFKLGNEQLANQAINNAIEVSGDTVYGKLGAAYKATRLQKNSEAISIVSNLLKENPEFIDGLILMGQLAFANQDFNAAADAFSKYLDLQPKDLTMKLMLANAYFKGKEIEKSEVLVDEVLQTVPNHAFTNQLKGNIRFQNQDFVQGFLFINKAMQGGINTINNKVVAGVCAFHLKNYEQSYNYLNAVKGDLPTSHLALKLLAITQLKLGYSLEASDTLENFTNLSSGDIELYTAASFELIKQGKTTLAKKLKDKAGGIEFTKPIDIARNGVLQLSLGDTKGINSLENALSLEDNMPEAKMMLAMAYVDNKEPQKAIDLLESWIKKEPGNVDSYNVTAVISKKIGEIERLESALSKALELNPANAMSLIYFAKQDMDKGKYNSSKVMLNQLLESQPDNIQALSLLYLLSDKMGNRELGKSKLRKAFENNMTDIKYRILYAKSLMLDNKIKEVITLLIPVNRNEELPNAYWLYLGDSYLANSELGKALETFSSWSENSPGKVMSWIRASMILEMQKEYSKGLVFINKGLKYSPQDHRLTLLQIHFNIQVNNLVEAQKLINKLPTDIKRLPNVEGLQGKILVNNRMYKTALPKLLISYEYAPTTKNAGLVYTALTKLHDDEEALSFLQKHIDIHPSHYILRHVLADKLSKNNTVLAYQHYSEIFKGNNNNFAVLNNMAWIDYKEGRFDKAKNTIEKALELAPKNPSLLDTAGLVYLSLNNKPEALKYLEKAYSLAPDNKEIQLHLKQAKESK